LDWIGILNNSVKTQWPAVKTKAPEEKGNRFQKAPFVFNPNMKPSNELIVYNLQS